MTLKAAFERFRWIFCRASLSCGFVFLAAGAAFLLHTAVFVRQAMPASGKILSLQPMLDQQNGTVNYAPIFTFAADDGKVYTVTANTATNPPGFEIGQTVRVLYRKADPGGARLPSFWQLWFLTICFLMLGVFSTAAGSLLLRYERRHKRRSAAAAIL